MIGGSSRPRLIRSRRVNPRISLFMSCETTTYYTDDEIPEIRLMTTASCNEPCTNIARRERLVHSKLCETPVFFNSLQESSDEDDFIALTAQTLIVKEAQVLSQGAHPNLSLNGKKAPKLSKFYSLKYYCNSNRSERCDLGSESELSLPPYSVHFLNDIDSQNTFSESSIDSSPYASDSDNFVRHPCLHLRTYSFSKKNRRLCPRSSVSVDEPFPRFLSAETDFRGLPRKSLSICGPSALSRKMPRKQSKAIKMLCASEGFMIPSMSRPSVHFGCQEFVTRTRRFSADQIKNVLFIPSGEIKIYRLTNEKFLNMSELFDVL